MNSSHKGVWAALHRTPHLTDKVLRYLIIAKGDPESIFAMNSQELTYYGVSLPAQQALKEYKGSGNNEWCQQIDRDWRILDELQIDVIALNSPLYPELLKQISDPPPLLYLRGNSSLLNRPQLAIVGSRKPSRQGSENAFRFSRELAVAGFTITSGLALGIDAQSHQGALAANGDTIAVLGTGVDRIYPARNSMLFDQILDKGLIVSEFQLGSEPKRYHFPLRNRVISGLSLGVLVVEAAIKSGSLISARSALEQNREVFAIPGSIHNPASKGCHILIRQGAKLVETASDIMEELVGWSKPLEIDVNGATPVQSTSNLLDIEPAEQQLLDLLGYDPVPIDILQQRSGLPVATLSARLTTLEIKGLVENLSGIFQRVT